MDFLSQLTSECSALLFQGKFADIAALNRGVSELLRPVLRHEFKKRAENFVIKNSSSALVIGANGFVGSHLVAHLSLNSKIHRVFAMVRATADKTPHQRFEETKNFYKIDKINYEKIVFISASSTEKSWGIEKEQYETLAHSINLVFNCASSTDYDVSYLSLRNDWVLGLLRVLQFCCDGIPKHLTYLGSVGARLYRDPEDFLRPDSWWYSGYSQMKWVNGEIIQWLARDNLLSVTLCEGHYIFGSTTVGVDPGLHYSWWRLVEVAKNIGKMWEGFGLNYCPVDVLVDCITMNALAETPVSFLCPCNAEPYDNNLYAEILGCELVSSKHFVKTAREFISPKRLVGILSEEFPELVRRSNHPAVFPVNYHPPKFSNRELLNFYINKINFRNIFRKKTQEECIL